MFLTAGQCRTVQVSARLSAAAAAQRPQVPQCRGSALSAAGLRHLCPATPASVRHYKTDTTRLLQAQACATKLCFYASYECACRGIRRQMDLPARWTRRPGARRGGRRGGPGGGRPARAAPPPPGGGGGPGGGARRGGATGGQRQSAEYFRSSAL